MYLFVIIGLIAVFVFVEGAGMGFPAGWITMIWDVPSLLMLAFITLPVLLASGLGKDFLNAFRLFFGKKEYSRLAERKKAIEALDVAIKSLRAGGIITVLLQFIGICNVLKEFDILKWQANMAVLLLPLVYAYMLNLLLLPIKSRLSKEVIDYMNDVEEI